MDLTAFIGLNKGNSKLKEAYVLIQGVSLLHALKMVQSFSREGFGISQSA